MILCGTVSQSQSGVPIQINTLLDLCFKLKRYFNVSIVVESHPDNALDDMRLDNPFPELREHVNSYDLDQMEKKVGTCSARSV